MSISRLHELHSTPLKSAISAAVLLCLVVAVTVATRSRAGSPLPVATLASTGSPAASPGRADETAAVLRNLTASAADLRPGDIERDLEAALRRGSTEQDVQWTAGATQPWEEVRERIADMAFGSEFDRGSVIRKKAGLDKYGRHRPDYASPRLNVRNVPIGELERVELDAIADSFNAAALQGGETLADELVAALSDQWQRGDFARRHLRGASAQDLADEASRTAGRKGFAYADSFTFGGWLISLSVNLADHPRLAARMKELRELCAVREAELRAYIEARS